KALFDLFVQRTSGFSGTDIANEYLRQAEVLRDILKDEETHRFFVHPHISGTKKREFFEAALSGNFDQDLTGLLFLTIAKNREVFLIKALDGLIMMLEAHLFHVRAQVVTAVPLTDMQFKRLEATLSDKLRKTVTLTASVDPAVLGGMYIHADGFFIDRTVRTKLRNMKSTIIKGASA
ncbi:MAG: ATP synthase F1 subunit delta, partial [Defluviitaleaceae bacterium]|nr:ATP synthase F1 subunit delta [Defluviitaleaceae bacterium]